MNIHIILISIVRTYTNSFSFTFTRKVAMYLSSGITTLFQETMVPQFVHAEPKKWQEIMVQGAKVVDERSGQKKCIRPNHGKKEILPQMWPNRYRYHGTCWMVFMVCLYLKCRNSIHNDNSQFSRQCDRHFRSPKWPTSKKTIPVKNNDLADFRNIFVEFNLVRTGE